MNNKNDNNDNNNNNINYKKIITIGILIYNIPIAFAGNETEYSTIVMVQSLSTVSQQSAGRAHHMNNFLDDHTTWKLCKLMKMSRTYHLT